MTLIQITSLSLTIFRMSRPFIALDEEASAHEESLYRGLSELHRNLTGMRFYHIFPNTLPGTTKTIKHAYLGGDASNLASIIRERIGAGRRALMERLKEWAEIAYSWGIGFKSGTGGWIPRRAIEAQRYTRRALA